MNKSTEAKAQNKTAPKSSSKKNYVSPTVVAVSTSKDQQTLQINACDSFIP